MLNNKNNKPTKHRHSAKSSALYYLSKREYSVYELSQKLEQKEYSDEEIDEALAFSCDNNYLSDLRYAQSQIRLQSSNGYGRLYIQQKISAQKVSQDLIDLAFEEEDIDFFELAKEKAFKKYGQKLFKKTQFKPLDEQKEYAKKMRYMQSKGFNYEQIKYALACLKDSQDEG